VCTRTSFDDGMNQKEEKSESAVLLKYFTERR
jgi:hypothetical protein